MTAKKTTTKKKTFWVLAQKKVRVFSTTELAKQEAAIIFDKALVQNLELPLN